ncbi:MAG: hypothetical protein MUF31_09695 [Akkermansiaceae bacterium]|jgi:hypothetical protein|nr:hypothetical protein [Akkermansiaceae bacterium]
MKWISWFFFFALALSPLLSGREFTGKNGKKIEAEILSKTAKEVELKLKDGRTLKVPLASLSEGDQLYVATWESPEEIQRKLKAIDPDEVLAAKGYVDFPFEIVGQATVVTLQLGGKDVKLMIHHGNEQPVILQSAMEEKELPIAALEGEGGGQVVGTYRPDKITNGKGELSSAEFLVAKIDGLPAGVDGLIGGQFFVDRKARMDFVHKKLWLAD